jgi:hypothetical protein
LGVVDGEEEEEERNNFAADRFASQEESVRALVYLSVTTGRREK